MIKKLKVPDSEADIYKNWKYTDKVYISCVCIAYNHGNYIRDALDSILAQQTEYRFELIIHDDKSTDGTREILLEYKNKFPNMITLILQDKNQYSKLKRIIPLTIPHIKGQYTALCEGDDFWNDEYKIQKQISALIKYPKVNLCINGAIVIDGNENILPTKFRKHRKNSGIIPYRNVFLTSGQFCATASMFFRTKMLVNGLPLFYKNAPVGDFPLEVYLSLNNIFYITDIMSVYRLSYINNSWSAQTLNDINIKISFLNEMKKSCWEIFTWLPAHKKLNIFYKIAIVNKELARCYLVKKSKPKVIKYWFYSFFLRARYNADDVKILMKLLK